MWFNLLVLGGIMAGNMAVMIPIPMVSMVTTYMEKESTGTHLKVSNTPSSLSSSRYVDPDQLSIYVNFTVCAYTNYK